MVDMALKTKAKYINDIHLGKHIPASAKKGKKPDIAIDLRVCNSIFSCHFFI